MNRQQKEICKYLLNLSYANGFDSGYAIKPIAIKLGISELDIYDNNTNTGLMWKYGSHGNGMLSFSDNGHGLYANVSLDNKELLENWVSFS